VPNKWLWAAVLYTVVITIASLAPTSQLPNVTIQYADKWVHLAIHFILFFGWAKGLEPLFTSSEEGKMLIWLLVACALYGIIIELFQEIFTTYRKADLMDVLANIAGTLLGLSIFNRVRIK
jgi:VanZ family protein